MHSRDSEQVILFVCGVRTFVIELSLCTFENDRSSVISFQCYFLRSKFLRLFVFTFR